MYKLTTEYFSKQSGLFKNLKNAGLYFLGSIVQSVLALIAQPIYSIHLSAEQFGILGYFEAIKSLFAPLFILSMTSVYLMQYFKQNEDENKKLLFNITINLIIINTISIFIGYIGVYIYFKSMGVNIPLNPFAWYILIALLLDNIKSVVLINFRIRKKALSYFTFSAINSIFNLGIGLLFVAVLQWGAEGRMLAPIISSLLLIPYSIHILKRYSTIYLDLKMFFKDLRVALPLVLAAYFYVPIISIDRMYLERLNNISELGLYNIGITIAGYVQLGYFALALAFEPEIFESVAQKNSKKLVKLFLLMFVPYLLMIFIFMEFSGIIIDLLTSGKYLGAQIYTNVTLVSVFLMGVFYFFDKILIAMGATKMNLLINIIGCISAISILYIAVDNYEFIGAAYGKVIVALLLVIISGWVAQKYFRLQKAIL